MEVFDECAIALAVREDLHRSYPDASMAYMKNGGNFPYLSRSEEVNLYLQVHLRRFELLQLEFEREKNADTSLCN